eukprot:scaffold55313_cov31-Tisochrysis_lutea.AAC.3
MVGAFFVGAAGDARGNRTSWEEAGAAADPHSVGEREGDRDLLLVRFGGRQGRLGCGRFHRG